MKKFFLLSLLVVASVFYLYRQNQVGSSQVVNVYSSRKEELVRTLFDKFTEKTGIQVRYITDDYSQLLSRIENGGEADVLLTADAVNLILAKKRGILSSVESDVLNDNIPKKFRDGENHWFGLTKRVRMIVYNKELVDVNSLSTYEDLASEKWKGKILIRSSTSPYNRSLTAFMIANNGFEKTKDWVKGIVNNMARKPSGGDIDQIYAVAHGEGEIAIVNSYYLARVLESDKDDIISKLGAFFPNQDDGGVMVNISGAAVVKNAANRQNAVKLLEFMVSKEAQELYSQKNYEYPIIEGIEAPNVLNRWGDYVQSDISLGELEKHLLEAVMVADEYKWK